MISLISSALIMLSPHQPLAQARELPVETAVENETADMGDEAAQEIRVHGLLEDHLLAHRGLQAIGELALLAIGQRDAGAHLGADAAQLRVDEVAVGGDHGGEVVDPPSLRQKSRELPDEGSRARPPRQLFRHRSSLQRLDPGPLENRPGLAIRFEELYEGLELAARRLPCPRLDGGAVKRLRVASGRALLRAHAA